MPTTNNMDSIREWLRTCPAVAQGVPFGADYLGDDPEKFALVSVTSLTRTKENIIGETIQLPDQQQAFSLDYRAPFSADPETNLATIDLFQAIHDWIMEQNNAGNFPAWHGGNMPRSRPDGLAHLGSKLLQIPHRRILPENHPAVLLGVDLQRVAFPDA